jgi:hypothetical protein
MKTFIAAIALTIAFPAAAQQSAQHQQHAQHQGMDHSQHKAMDHGKDGKDAKGCCDMKCCDEAKKAGKKMKCCDKAADQKGMKH